MHFFERIQFFDLEAVHFFDVLLSLITTLIRTFSRLLVDVLTKFSEMRFDVLKLLFELMLQPLFAALNLLAYCEPLCVLCLFLCFIIWIRRADLVNLTGTNCLCSLRVFFFNHFKHSVVNLDDWHLSEVFTLKTVFASDLAFFDNFWSLRHLC